VRGRVAVLFVAIAAAAVACQPTTVSRPEVTGLSATAAAPEQGDPQLWARISGGVEQPADLEAVPTDASGHLIFCAECHYGSYATMAGVTAGPAGLVAVGWISPDDHGASWRSADGQHWSLVSELDANTALSSIASDAGIYVAGGLDRSGGTIWASTDGRVWQPADTAPAFEGLPLHVTAVTHWAHGFAAAGFEGSEFTSPRAAFWVSPDGLSWRRAPDSEGLRNARALAITAMGSSLVAVGASGPSNDIGPAVAWTSSDGLVWQRTGSGIGFEHTEMRTVTFIRNVGIVAAGDDRVSHAGVVWTSLDGVAWSRAAIAGGVTPAGARIEMSAVAGGGPGVVIAGRATEGTQSNEAAVWTSTNGATWIRRSSGSEFSYSEIAALTPWQSGLVAVGDSAIPDEYIATVWLSPAAWHP
jgi:hypothetical protein